MIEHLKKITKKDDILNYTLDERRIIYVLGKINLAKEIFKFRPLGGLQLLLEEKNQAIDDIPKIDISLAKEMFNFPPNHPQKDNFYVMNELLPNKYFPAEDFNRHNNELKYTSFIELCANLGARKILAESININGEEKKLEANVPIPIDEKEMINAGIRIGKKYDKETNLILEAEFGEGNKGIKEYNSPWLETEKTWETMCKLRTENDVKEYSVNFNYTEFSIVKAKGFLGKIFNSSIESNMTNKIKMQYRVLFW